MRKILFVSAARTSGTHYSPGITADGHLGARFYLNTSAGSGTTTDVTVSIEAFDHVSTTWVPIPGASFAAVTSTSTTKTLSIHPALSSTINVTVGDVLGGTIRAKAVVQVMAAGTWTFSLGADLVR